MKHGPQLQSLIYDRANEAAHVIRTEAADCRVHNATLVIAKLDRLARNVHFISGLMESKIDFVAVDFPHANRLTVHILAAVAEHEREMISKRTKEALAAARRRGTKLGGHRSGALPNADEGRAKGRAARAAKANTRAADILLVIEDIRLAHAGEGLSLRQIAAGLNGRGIRAPRGGDWSAVQVKRVIDRQVVD
jgi:DNA invertase Pin-like site-specific DNA recombinase